MRGSAQDLVKEMQAELDRLVYEAPPAPSGYVRTGFLRASLVASTEAMPQLVRDNPGAPVSADEMAGIILVINGWDGGGTLYPVTRLGTDTMFSSAPTARCRSHG